MLRLRSFGSVFVERDGRPLDGASRQRRVVALLSMLAVAGDGGLSRDRVLALLWSDGDPDRSRQALTQALYHARRALDQDDLFFASADLRLNPAVIESDVAEFEQLLELGALEQAVALYHGPFLDGFHIGGAPEFERWASVERDRLAGHFARALDDLAMAAEAAADYRSAVEYRKRRAAMDPFNSRVALELMTALATSGDRAGAIQHARIHETLLREELGVAPDAAVTELVERLRAAATPTAVADSAMAESTADINEEATTADPAIGAAPPARGEPALGEALLATTEPVRVGGSRRDAIARVAGRAMEALRRRRLVAPLAALLAAVAIALAAWVQRPVASDGEAQLAARRDMIVVVPFRVTGADPALAYLHEGMVDLLVTKLTEDDAMQAADPGSIMSAWRHADIPDRTEVPSSAALAVARQIGAERLVLGSVVGTPRRAVISASVLGAAAGEVRAQATVEGPVDSLTVLVDRLAARLLAKEAGVAERLASHTSTSLVALRAFLQGQAAYRRGSYRAAMQHYQRALDRDPTFAMAGLGLAQAANRIGAREAQMRGTATAWSSRLELTEPDRLYLEAMVGPRYPSPSSRRELLTAWEHAASEMPNRAGVWHELGERLFHDGQVLGIRDWSTRAAAAFRRAVQLDSGFVAPLQFLVQLAASADDTAEVRRVATLYTRRDSTGDLAAFVRWRSAVALSDRARLAAVRRQLPSLPSPTLLKIVLASQFDGFETRDAEQALGVLDARAARRSERVDVLLGRHAFALNAGQPERARQLVADLGELQPASTLAERLAVLDALYGDGDSSAAHGAVGSLARADSALAARLVPDVAARATAADDDRITTLCVLGQWWAWRGETQHAQRASSTIAPGQATVPAEGIGPACAALIDAIDAVRLRRVDADDRIGRVDSLLMAGAPLGELHGYAHLALARLRALQGDSALALATVRRRPFMQEWPHYLASQLDEEGRLALAVGDTAAAASAYRRLLALRRAPEPSVAPSVAAVRALLDQLPESEAR